MSKSKGATAPTPKAAIEAVRNLFGEHPEDVISPLDSASDAMTWLGEIFRIIADGAMRDGSALRIKLLAEAGAYIACDVGNYVDDAFTRMMDCLRAAGAVPAEGEAE